MDFILSLNGQVIDTVAATANTDGVKFDVAQTAAQTSAYPIGRYKWVERVTKTADTTQVHTIGQGFFQVEANFGISQTPTANQTILANMQTQFTALVNGTIASATVNGQSWSKKNMLEFQKAIDRQQAIVDAELIRLGLAQRGNMKKFVTRFCQ